jgi:hypothetical protein
VDAGRTGGRHPAIAALSADLSDGTWEARNRALLELDEIDAGARLLIAG